MSLGRVARLRALFSVAAIALGACGGAAATPVRSVTPPPTEGAASCGGLSAIALAPEPIPLLADWLRLRMPAGTSPAPPDDRERAPVPPVLLESTVAFADADVQLEVRAMEILRRRGEGSLAAQVESYLESLGHAGGVEPLTLAPGLRGVLVPPTEESLRRRGDIGSVILHGEDGVLMDVSFAVPPGSMRGEEVTSCREVTRRIAETLAPGERRLDLAGGPVTLPYGLSLALPPDYLAVTYRGPDFEVHYFFPIVPLGAPQAQLGIYLGTDPASHVGDVLEMRRMEGTLLGRAAQWLRWTSASHGARLHHREAMTELEDTEGAWVHVFVTAPDEESAESLGAILETLR